MAKRTAQKDTIIDTTSNSQVNNNFPNRWSSLTFNNYFYLLIYLYITRITINNNTPHLKSPTNQNRRANLGRPAVPAMKLLGRPCRRKEILKHNWATVPEDWYSKSIKWIYGTLPTIAARPWQARRATPASKGPTISTVIIATIAVTVQLRFNWDICQWT